MQGRYITVVGHSPIATGESGACSSRKRLQRSVLDQVYSRRKGVLCPLLEWSCHLEISFTGYCTLHKAYMYTCLFLNLPTVI